MSVFGPSPAYIAALTRIREDEAKAAAEKAKNKKPTPQEACKRAKKYYQNLVSVLDAASTKSKENPSPENNEAKEVIEQLLKKARKDWTSCKAKLRAMAAATGEVVDKEQGYFTEDETPLK